MRAYMRFGDRLFFPMYKSSRDMTDQRWVLCTLKRCKYGTSEDVAICAEGYATKYSYIGLIDYWIQTNHLKIYEDGDKRPTLPFQKHQW